MDLGRQPSYSQRSPREHSRLLAWSGGRAVARAVRRVRTFWMHRGHMHRSQQPSVRWLALGVLTLGLLVPAGGAHGQPSGAAAALSPHVQFLGDSTGTVFTFTVTNPVDGQSVGTVDIDSPSRFWTALSCPQAPAGWTAETDGDGCSYRNPGDPAGDLAPGTSSSAFQLVATSGEATADRTGTFRVGVGGSDASDDDDLAPVAAALPGGLDITAY